MDQQQSSIRANASFALIPGLMMALYGWMAGYEPGGSPLHAATVHIFNFTLRIGGPALIIAALLCWLNLNSGRWVDAASSTLCGALLVTIGIYWIAVDTDLNDFIYT